MTRGGICLVNRNSIEYILSRNGTGNAVVIVVGGAAESLNCAPSMNSVTLKNRKVFVKLALQQGADLVPVYSFGENEVYKQLIFEEGTWWRLAQRRLQELLGFAICLFHLGPVTFTWGLVPYCKPITTVVGEPITVPKIEEPSQEVVDQYHAMYISSLVKLFDEYKVRFAQKHSVLEVQ
ncbi:diacylglycerol O-acyltransferase 2-like [Conger conger]|uniref:diacylglycerol O-acyltransferase 2-like n=1 Tax=Conger conger TaxID=82655 RepID=UPI002A5AA806|nr:diacylglycerol O-acyltransferase 2-like [Conger conger]